jgi:hypothetical protein
VGSVNGKIIAVKRIVKQQIVAVKVLFMLVLNKNLAHGMLLRFGLKNF